MEFRLKQMKNQWEAFASPYRTPKKICKAKRALSAPPCWRFLVTTNYDFEQWLK